MSMQKDDDQPATRGDVREIVGEVVGEIVGTALQLISEQLATKADKADVDKLAEKADIARLENKLTPTIDDVDDLKAKWRQQFGTV